ncbi:MAG: formate--tetrahydrofolate ligase [Candidatus Kariarchaeaceae archaeon]
MKSSIEIAQEAKLKPIMELGKEIGIQPEELEPYGHFKGKVSLTVLERMKDKPDGKYVLVTGITPTMYGEGKTIHTIGMTQALNKIGVNAACVIRQASMGPVFGIKGGAAGGGFSQVLPMADINLGLNGDIDKVAAAHNLLAALMDAHIYRNDNELDFDLNEIYWKRSMDMNDRALREIILNPDEVPTNGVKRRDGFEITAASEVMAILALASDITDLKERLSRLVLGKNTKGELIRAKDLQAQGAMTLILKDAIKPNLCQTYEGGPAFIHAGPFANIATGTSSVLADRIALKLSDVVLTEAGFGSDLGGEKFMNIKSRMSGLNPSAVILVSSVRALKRHGEVDKLESGTPESLEGLRKGCENLAQHISNMKSFNKPVFVAINTFAVDLPTELEIIKEEAIKAGATGASITRLFLDGGKGGEELAHMIMDAIKGDPEPIKFTYAVDDPVEEKCRKIARQAYGADDVIFTEEALADIEQWIDLGYGDLPICMAKTQMSLSDDVTVVGRPTNYNITIRNVRLSAGAGFLYALCGKMLTMPGLSDKPAARVMDYHPDGTITGLY